MQKVRRHGTRPLRPLVSTRVQVLFHSPSGVLFTFPSRYWFTIGHLGVFSLAGWSPRVPAGFPVPGRTQVPCEEVTAFSRTGLLPSMAAVSTDLPLTQRFVTSRPRCGTIMQSPTTPEWKRPQAIAPFRFGLIPFRSPLLRESIFLSLPVGTEMVHFPTLSSHRLWIERWILRD